MGMILWLVALVVAIIGIFQLIQGQILWGIILLVLAAAIGPGGWSMFGRKTV